MVAQPPQCHGLCPSQGLHWQGTSPDAVPSGLRAAGHILSSVLWPTALRKTLLVAGEAAPSLCLLCSPRPVTAGIPGRCMPKCPSQSQPMPMLLPRGGLRGKSGACTAFVHVAKTPKQLRALHQPHKSSRLLQVDPAPAACPPTTTTGNSTPKPRPPPQEKPGGWGKAPCASGER